MSGRLEVYPYRLRRLDEGHQLAVSQSGDHVFLSATEADLLSRCPHKLPLARRAEFQSKFFLGDRGARGFNRLLASRLLTKCETVLNGPSLHIIVTTLQCGHTCRYCQVSRSLDDAGYTISQEDLAAACDSIFQSPAETLTVEFQGGDPLLRFDLITSAIERIKSRNRSEGKQIRFVVASTLHQLDDDSCAFLKAHGVYLSSSIDGPAPLHNRNRPTPTLDAYERTVAGIQKARALISPDAVSALMTTTRDSLAFAEEIVDEYVRLGFDEIFIRPLSNYGFARKNRGRLAYSVAEFCAFYERAFDRVLYWNRKGVQLREVAASIALNKVLSPFDAGYVDLQSPTGAGLAVLLYNYDGYVYPSDEARMLAESGDKSLRLGRIGDSIDKLLATDLQQELIRSSISHAVDGCRDCAYNRYCGPDPISSYNQWASFSVPVHLTEHCHRQMGLFDFLFYRLRDGDEWFSSLAHRWAQPPTPATPVPSNRHA